MFTGDYLRRSLHFRPIRRKANDLHGARQTKERFGFTLHNRQQFSEIVRVLFVGSSHRVGRIWFLEPDSVPITNAPVLLGIDNRGAFNSVIANFILLHRATREAYVAVCA